MDNGEVIIGLNEPWTLGGAKLNEWIAGFTVFLIAAEVVFNPVTKHMPHLMITWVMTTFGLAALRRSFPDEERGIRNFFCTAVGVAPIGIPAPAQLQPYWSGAPVKALNPECDYTRLELEKVFVSEEEQDIDVDSFGAGYN